MQEVKVEGAQPEPVADRTALRAELEATRADFHRLLDNSVRGNRWRQKSAHSAWTVGEVLVHLAWALEYLPKEVAMARRGKGMFNMPKWLADPGSYWLIRWQARTSDPTSVRRRYDNAMDATIKALETVPEGDWDNGAPFYGEGFHTVADLFREPARHLAEHARGL